MTVPLDRRADFDIVRPFARDAARVLSAREPDLVTTEARKAMRRGRLYMDVMRNAYAQTAAPPYAVRARAGAPVATPLDWAELSARLDPDRFTMKTVPRRLARDGDPWKGMSRRARSLAKARRRLDALLDEEVRG